MTLTAQAAAIAHLTAEVARLTAENDRLLAKQAAVDDLAERREQTLQKICQEAQQ